MNLEYELLEEIQCEGYRKKVIRMKDSGAIVDMRIPNHTPEEEEELSAKLARALFEFAYPDEDWSKVKHLRVIT